MPHFYNKIKYTLQSDAFPVLLGQVAAQVLLFVALPLISRAYDEGSVGDWSVLQSMAVLLWSFSQLKTDWSLVQASDDRERSDLFAIGLSAHAIICAVLMAIAQISGLSAKLPSLVWVFGGLLAFGFNQMVYSLLLAVKQYRAMGWLRALTALGVFPGSLISIGFFPEQGLLLAWLVGHIAPALWFYLTCTTGIRLTWRDGYTRLGIHWSRHRKLMTFGSALAVLDTAADQLLLLSLAWYYPAGTVAAYFFALKFCSAPVSLLAGALGSVNFVRYQQLYREKRLDQQVLWRFWTTWLPVAALYYGCLMVFGSAFFPWLLGAQWHAAGHFTVLLAVLGFVQFLTSPVSSIFIVLRKPEYPLWLSAFTIVRLAVSAVMMAGGYNLQRVLLVFVTIGLVHYGMYNLLQFRMLQRLV